MPRSLTIVVLTLILMATGCARVSDGAGGEGVRQLVTADRGATTLSDGQVGPDQSAMAALRATTAVETSYGGGFVSAMFGRRSDRGGTRDWLYFVNGMSPGHGADQQTLRRGDVVWWDFHPWGGQPTASAVVGSWPEPFVNGYPSAPDGVAADAPLDEPLRRAGVTLVSGGDGGAKWRVRVGASDALAARDPAWRTAMADPEALGMTVRIVHGRVEALTIDGARFAPVAGGRAVAALVPTGPTPDAGGALLAVAGLDVRSARAAAQRIAADPAVLRSKFAVVFDERGEPIAAGGQVRR